MLNINTTINSNSVLYSSGIKSYNDIALSIGIAASLWIFCIIAFNIFNEARKNKYQNVMDSTSNMIFLFSLLLMILVMLFTVINHFINLYLSFLVFTVFTIRTRVNDLSEAKKFIDDFFHKNNITIKYIFNNVSHKKILNLVIIGFLVFMEYLLNILWGIAMILESILIIIDIFIGQIGKYVTYCNYLMLICFFSFYIFRIIYRLMRYRMNKVAGRSGTSTVTANN